MNNTAIRVSRRRAVAIALSRRSSISKAVRKVGQRIALDRAGQFAEFTDGCFGDAFRVQGGERELLVGLAMADCAFARPWPGGSPRGSGAGAPASTAARRFSWLSCARLRARVRRRCRARRSRGRPPAGIRVFNALE
jgi:hypothetical protein